MTKVKKPRRSPLYYVRHEYSVGCGAMRLLKKQPTAHGLNLEAAPYIYFIEAASAQEALWLMWTQAALLGRQPQRCWLNETSVWMFQENDPDLMRLYIEPPDTEDGPTGGYLRKRATDHGAKIVPRGTFWAKWKKKGFYAPRRKRG